MLERKEVIDFLNMARPDLSEDDWQNADLITVLRWAMPTYQAWLNNGLISKKMMFEYKHRDDLQ